MSIKRSFYVHVFLVTLICVAGFLGASRYVVRHATDVYVLNYFNETLAHHTAREIDQATQALDARWLKQNLTKSIDDLHPDEMHVALYDLTHPVSVDDPWQLAVTNKDLVWQTLSHQSATHPFEFVYLTFKDQVWSVLKTPDKGRVVYVAIQRAALIRSFEEILNVRNEMTYRMLPVLLVFVLLFTLFTSYTAISPIIKLQKAFTQIHIRSSNEHISLRSNYREFSDFIGYFNALIDRLRASYQQAARFSSDASHELRTPLTIIRGHIGRLINQAQDGSPTQLELALVAEEVERLIAISNKLLWLSQADAGQTILDKRDVKFHEVAGQMLDDLRMFHPHLNFSTDISSPILLRCDHDLLLQLLGNLFSNAIKYNHPQGRVHFFAKAQEGQLCFSISNTTHLSLDGLDERVFERFYRYRKAANQQLTSKSGSGLGLSLCQEILHAHGGSIRLVVNSEGLVCFECTLPMS